MTAPSDGTFSFGSELKSLDRYETDVYVLGNSGTSTLCSGNLSGTYGAQNQQTATFSFSQFLTSGNTIDFVTHSSTGATFRGTGLEATISEQGVTTTPEPSSMALLGTGLIGLVPMLRRRRKA